MPWEGLGPLPGHCGHCRDRGRGSVRHGASGALELELLGPELLLEQQLLDLLELLLVRLGLPRRHPSGPAAGTTPWGGGILRK